MTRTTYPLRLIFIFFLIQIVPLDWKFYRDLFSVNWFHYSGIFQLAHYLPRFGEVPRFADWGIFLLVAAVGALLWTYLEQKKNHEVSNDALYYWLRVFLRYRP